MLRNLGIVICVFANVLSPLSARKIKPATIMISQIVEHPALNRTREGIIDALKEAGFVDGYNAEITVESAQGQPLLARQIAQKFVGKNPDVVVGIGTITAQCLMQASSSSTIPVIFSSVTDPLGAGLVQKRQKPVRSVSGVSNFVALEPQLALFRKIVPSLKTLGILYNAAESNSQSIVEKLRVLCAQLGITLVEQTAKDTAEVPQSALALAARVDALFVSNDNTGLAALPSVLSAATQKKIPVFVSDTDAVQEGAVAALGPDQYAVGQQTGRRVARLLNSAAIADQAVEFPDRTDLYINIDAARRIGLEIPKDVLKQAARVISLEKDQ